MYACMHKKDFSICTNALKSMLRLQSGCRFAGRRGLRETSTRDRGLAYCTSIIVEERSVMAKQ